MKWIGIVALVLVLIVVSYYRLQALWKIRR